MNFCYNCGAKLAQKEIYCSECGCRLEDTICDIDDSSNQDCSTGTTYKVLFSKSKLVPKSEIDNSNVKIGVILTNSTLLADKFRVDQSAIVSLIDEYISILKSFGVEYTLLDMSSFTSSNRWYDFHPALLSKYKELQRDENEVLYLFIIGGDDIIPVPVINNYIPNDRDADIATDMLYAYPYGKACHELLESCELYKAELLYAVSRLPLASDALFEHLLDYLQRSINCHSQGGIELNRAYGQSDPHWQNVSNIVADSLYECNIFQDKQPNKGCNRSIWVSPPMSCQDINNVFDSNASIYYFNLHGSNAPTNSGYVGELYPNQKEYFETFSTQIIRNAQRDNVIVAECCYGAKFVGYDIEHSMLNSALTTNTMLFFASSRIAYGALDVVVPNMTSLHSADLICNGFIDGLLMGLSAADASLLARSLFFDSGMPISEHAALTLAEFNLFGDPTLGVGCRVGKSVSNKNYKAEYPRSNRQIAPKNADIEMRIEDITPSKLSLLNRVRGAVDANITQMTEKIGKNLYEVYGMSARKPKQILKVRYKNGISDYSVIYETSNSKLAQYTIVKCDDKGNIKSVVVSK